MSAGAGGQVDLEAPSTGVMAGLLVFQGRKPGGDDGDESDEDLPEGDEEVEMVPEEDPYLIRDAANRRKKIIPDIANPFFPLLVRGVEVALSKAGYSLFLCNSACDILKEKDYVQLLMEKGVTIQLRSRIHQKFAIIDKQHRSQFNPQIIGQIKKMFVFYFSRKSV